ncbi:coiled-coil domain-containing protein 15 [Gouania willdenowi]|uniref:Coiled-coil domain-containing protein 15 n=1 Tax=Gouania willdenowi TaxID=441366 RepID=A0A8C5EQM6_GOUWI|nr:coiled-coil domain-containing protein 15 [Gouania willdenowi]
MSSARVKALKSARKTNVHRDEKLRTTRASRVLAERNQAVVAVGAWVESGEDFTEHPSALAVVTDELQAERRRVNTESLLRFQDEVRHRVAHRVQVTKKRQPAQTERVATPNIKTPPQLWTGTAPGLSTIQQRVTESSFQKSSAGTKQVRLRLAACRVIPREEETSDLPGGKWNVSPSRHCADEGGSAQFDRRHQCPLVQQKATGHVWWEADEAHADDFEPNPSFSAALWPLNDPEELKRQRQSEFLLYRRLVMELERERVKENKQQRKHLRRTARIKAEKEQLRLQEERRLEEAQQLKEVQRKLEERELLIMERLRLEEDRAKKLQRKKREEKGKESERFVDALRAQMKERLSHFNDELPLLCCCASSFWDSHPETCANNCIFYDNPKAYTQALHSTMVSLELK